MFQIIHFLLDLLENILWEYLGAPIIVILGIFLSLRSQFFQVRHFPRIVKHFLSFFTITHNKEKGIHPLKAFFACVGGCVGIGNIVGICTAVQVGGPGALLWIWVTALLGSVVKYAEVYLGVKYRVENQKGSYNGGPMYFLQRISPKGKIPWLVALLLCIYGVEVYQFSVITESLSNNYHLDHTAVAGLLLLFVAFAAGGGIGRVGTISSAIIPVFVVLYMGMGLWILFQNIATIPLVLKQVFTSAFTPSSAVGGFLGSTMMLTISQGVRRGCYSSDVGVGYASVIHSESSAESPEKQASLVIFDVFLDTFLICTMSVMLILVTGVWSEPIKAGLLVQTAMSQYFPYVDVFMPLFLFLLGYSTITAYYCVGVKCAEFIFKDKGKIFFNIYAFTAFILSMFADTREAQAVMSISGGMLLVINCWGIWRLRHEVSFSIKEERDQIPVSDPVTNP